MATAPNPPPYRMKPRWATLTEGVNDPPPATATTRLVVPPPPPPPPRVPAAPHGEGCQCGTR